jgi:hypothetical protein
MTDLLTGLAFFLIIEGLLYAAAPSLVKNLASIVPSIPENRLRMSGLVAMIAGVVSVWLVRG